jgi:hypothetical protein
VTAVDPRRLSYAAGRVLVPIRDAADREVRRLRREIAAPWREGREGVAAETGRWIGVTLAAGAFLFGVAAAWVATRRD